MARKMLKLLRRLLVLLVVVAVALLAARAWDSQRGPPLEPWHTYVPHDWHAAEIDKADWAAYVAAEEAAFRDRDVFVFRDHGGQAMVLHRKRDGKMELIEVP